MRYKDLIINNYTCNGQCSNCGQCCGDILHLSNQEIKRIDDYLKTHKVEETPRCIIYEYDNTCPFRDNENKKFTIGPNLAFTLKMKCMTAHNMSINITMMT